MKSLSKLICLIFGCDFYVVKRYSEHMRRIKCVRCKQEYGMNDELMICISWCKELAEFNNDGWEEILLA